MTYPQDPGGRFASDVHRRTLAHLSHPDDEYGWNEPALLERMRPDVATSIETIDELKDVLADLEKEGHASQPQEGVWRMTQGGYEVLTGGIANEPPPGAAVLGAAVVNAPGVAAATRLSGDGPAGVNQEDYTPEGEEIPPPVTPTTEEPQQ